MSRLERMLWEKNLLLEYANKKIRPQDTRKQERFAELLTEFNKLYERKVVEKANFIAEEKKKREERPRFPDEVTTVRFRRYSGGGSNNEVV